MKDTIFLLDVDGPINGSKTGWSKQPLRGYAKPRDSEITFRMQWSGDLISKLREFNRRWPETIYWATTWCGSTDLLEDLFKLPALLSAASSRMSGEMKLQAAKDVLASGKRLIWADDEYVPTSGSDYDMLTQDGRALLLKPRNTGRRQGLRPEDINKIFAFMENES